MVSEKSYGLLEESKYTFLVAPQANKTEIKIAVEKVFGVKVVSVNTINRQGKRKRTRAGYAKRKNTKRAIVTLVRRKQADRDLRRPGRVRDWKADMGIRKYKPTTPGRRGASVSDFAEITRSTPEKSLLRPLHGHGGRNAHGKVTTRHKGGGHKRSYRLIDFRRADKDGVPAKVAHIEYDPNRTARIALLHYVDGEKRYIIAPEKLLQGDRIENGPRADIKPGNNLPLRNIPVGTVVHAIELRPGGGAKMAPLGRCAACSWSPRTVRTRSCGSPRARCATWTCAAAPPSARSATPNTATSTGARQAGCGGRASARLSVVSP